MPSDVDPQILWETTKCAIQGFCISFSSTLAKAKTHQFTQLEDKIQSLQNLQKQHFTEQQATLRISSMQKRMLFAGFTAVKKTIIQNWFTPHMCRKAYWIRSLLQIVSCECTTARVGGARPSTIDAWQCFLLNIRDYIKE